MAFLSLMELFDIVVMALAVGFIFSDRFGVPRPNYEPLKYINRFDWEQLLIAAAIVAPGIILHEFAHKIVAMIFGLSASFNAAYMFLGLGLLLKFLNFGFIFFVPAYVSIIGRASPLSYSLIAFAGPLMNLLIWAAVYLLLKFNMINRKYVPVLELVKKINFFLFVFNMIPIPGFDGFQAFSELLNYFFPG